jgi:hypothetical protein
MNPNFDYRALEEWIAERPEHVQKVIRLMPPDRWYLAKGGKKYQLKSYDEEKDGTVSLTCYTTDLLGITYEVFGMKPESFTPGEYITE